MTNNTKAKVLTAEKGRSLGRIKGQTIVQTIYGMVKESMHDVDKDELIALLGGEHQIAVQILENKQVDFGVGDLLDIGVALAIGEKILKVIKDSSEDVNFKWHSQVALAMGFQKYAMRHSAFKELLSAIKFYKDALENKPKDVSPEHLARIENNLGLVLNSLAAFE
ncbi:MAG: hypothetical protein QM520_04290, partial [Gammaproteobacteria bacterium]|nr:hypothetical protein [Gammaproteobacteria bacterium]